MLKFLFSNKGLVYIALGNLLGAVLTGFLWLFMAAVQNADDYGKTTYLISVSSLVTFVSLLGLNTTVNTFSAKGMSNLNVQANQLAMISGVIFSLIVSFLLDWKAGLFVISMVFWMMSLYDFLGKKMYKEYAIANVGARAMQFVLSFFLYSLFGVEGVVIGFTISYFAFSYRYFSSLKKFDFKFFELKGKMKFSIHAYAFNLSTAFLLYFDKLLILPLFGYAILGYYQISVQFLLFIGMIPISLYQYLLSEESDGIEKKRVRIIGFAISIILAISLVTLSPLIINNFFPSFTNSIDAVRITSSGIIPMMIVWTTNSKLFNIGKSKLVAIGSGIYLSTQTCLIYLLGYDYGVTGLATALVVALCTQALFLYYFQKRLHLDVSEAKGKRV